MKWKKKTVQDVKSIKKTQTEGRLEVKNLGTRLKTSEASLVNRIQEMEKRIQDIEDKIEETDISAKESVKSFFKKIQVQNMQEILATQKISNGN